MKKSIIFCLFVCLFSMGLVASDSWAFDVKIESLDIPVIYEPASFLKYSHVLSQNPRCIYEYEMLTNKASGNQTWQSIAAELDRSLLNQRVNLFAGIGFTKIGLNLNQPEYVMNSNFITQFGESPDSQVCLGDSVSAKSKYQLFWYVGARLSILKGKNWKAGVEGRYLSLPNFNFSFPLQYKSNDWKKADMEFSVKGNSLKLQMAEVKVFTAINLSKKLEMTGAVGYLDEKKEISGKSRYAFYQYPFNIDYNQDWKLMAKPETNFFAEGSIGATLARNLKVVVSGSVGAKRGFSVGILYSPSKKEKATNIVKPVTMPTPKPAIKPAPVKSAALKKVADKPVIKLTAKPVQKKIVVASKERTKKTTIAKPTPPCISKTYTYIFRLGMRLLGFNFIDFGFQFGTIPNTTPKTSKK